MAVFRQLRVVSAVAAAVMLSQGALPADAGGTGVVTKCERSDYGCVAYSGYQGKDSWGYAGSNDSTGHNCTTYVAYRLAQNGAPNPGSLGDAYMWDNRAAQYGILVDRLPVVGAVAQWEANTPYTKAGHVAYVEEVTASDILISEDAWGTGKTALRRISRSGTAWPSHFIHVWDRGSTIVGARFVGDWDGNGSTTPGVVYRTTAGLQWHLRNSNSAGAAWTVFRYGDPRDTPVIGNWDGRGGDSIGIVRVVSGSLQWHLRNYNSAGPANAIVNYGLRGDIPVVGNWDNWVGDTIGIARPTSSGMQWHLRNYNSGGPAGVIFNYGLAGDIPITGNWDGVGGDTVGIARSVSGGIQWHLRNGNSGGPASTVFWYGIGTDSPIVGNWDAHGGDTVGIVRRAPTGIQWHIRNYNSGGPATSIFYYGSSTQSLT